MVAQAREFPVEYPVEVLAPYFRGSGAVTLREPQVEFPVQACQDCGDSW